MLFKSFWIYACAGMSAETVFFKGLARFLVAYVPRNDTVQVSLYLKGRCCNISEELLDLFIRDRLNDKIYFFRWIHMLKVTEMFLE